MQGKKAPISSESVAPSIILRSPVSLEGVGDFGTSSSFSAAVCSALLAGNGVGGVGGTSMAGDLPVFDDIVETQQ